MPRRVLILSDQQIGSYARIGDLLARTLETVGMQVDHAPLGGSASAASVPAGTLVIHNTIGPRFQPSAGRREVAMVHHEWDRYPSSWVRTLNRYRAVWTTTRFVKATLRRSGVTVPIALVRPALDLDPVPRKTDYRTSGPFRFFACGAPHFRKGFHLLMEGFTRAFPKVGEAELTIHTAPGGEWGTPRADIRVRDVRLSQEALFTQYREFDAFVSASLGEGLGLPVAEAILAGLPVLANDWGGHGDLLRPGAFFRLPHAVAPQPYCSRPDYYAPGQQCAVATVEQMARALRLVASSTSGARAAMAASARLALRARYGQRAVRARVLAQRLKASRSVASVRGAAVGSRRMDPNGFVRSARSTKTARASARSAA